MSEPGPSGMDDGQMAVVGGTAAAAPNKVKLPAAPDVATASSAVPPLRRSTRGSTPKAVTPPANSSTTKKRRPGRPVTATDLIVEEPCVKRYVHPLGEEDGEGAIEGDVDVNEPSNSDQPDQRPIIHEEPCVKRYVHPLGDKDTDKEPSEFRDTSEQSLIQEEPCVKRYMHPLGDEGEEARTEPGPSTSHQTDIRMDSTQPGPSLRPVTPTSEQRDEERSLALETPDTEVEDQEILAEIKGGKFKKLSSSPSKSMPSVSGKITIKSWSTKAITNIPDAARLLAFELPGRTQLLNDQVPSCRFLPQCSSNEVTFVIDMKAAGLDKESLCRTVIGQNAEDKLKSMTRYYNVDEKAMRLKFLPSSQTEGGDWCIVYELDKTTVDHGPRGALRRHLYFVREANQEQIKYTIISYVMSKMKKTDENDPVKQNNTNTSPQGEGTATAAAGQEPRGVVSILNRAQALRQARDELPEVTGAKTTNARRLNRQIKLQQSPPGLSVTSGVGKLPAAQGQAGSVSKPRSMKLASAANMPGKIKLDAETLEKLRASGRLQKQNKHKDQRQLSSALLRVDSTLARVRTGGLEGDEAIKHITQCLRAYMANFTTRTVGTQTLFRGAHCSNMSQALQQTAGECSVEPVAVTDDAEAGCSTSTQDYVPFTAEPVTAPGVINAPSTRQRTPRKVTIDIRSPATIEREKEDLQRKLKSVRTVQEKKQAAHWANAGLDVPDVGDDQCEELAIVGLTVNLRTMLVIRTAANSRQGYTFMQSGKVVDAFSNSNRLLFVLEQNTLPCRSECEKINDGHRDGCKPAELLTIMAQQAVRLACKSILDDGCRIWDAHKTGMREVFVRMLSLGYARHEVLKALPVCSATNTILLYRQHRKKRLASLKMKLNQVKGSAAETKQMMDEIAVLESLTRDTNIENEDHRFRRQELHQRMALDTFAVADAPETAGQDGVTVMMAELNPQGDWINAENVVSDDDDGPDTTERLEQRRRRWTQRILLAAPVQDTPRSRAALKQPVDDDECAEMAYAGFSSGLRQMVLVRSEQQPRGVYQFFLKNAKNQANAMLRAHYQCARCVAEVDGRRKEQRQYRLENTVAPVYEHGWNRMRALYIRADKLLPCRRACLEIDDGHSAYCQPYDYLEILCQQSVRRVGVDILKGVSDNWTLHKNQMHLAYLDALSVGYTPDEILCALPWFSSPQVHSLYSTFYRRAAEAGVACPEQAHYDTFDLKENEIVENKHRNCEEPYNEPDNRVSELIESKDYAAVAVQMDLNPRMRGPFHGQIGPRTISMFQTRRGRSAQKRPFEQVIEDFSEVDSEDDDDWIQQDGSQPSTSATQFPARMGILPAHLWQAMQEDAHRMVHDGAVIAFPGQADLYMIAVNRQSMTVERAEDGILRCSCSTFAQWSYICAHSLAVAIFSGQAHQFVRRAKEQLLMEKKRQKTQLGTVFRGDSDGSKRMLMSQHQIEHAHLVISAVEWRIIQEKAADFHQRQIVSRFPNERDLYLVTVDRQPFTVQHLGAAAFQCNCDQYEALELVCMHTMAVAHLLGLDKEYKNIVEAYVDAPVAHLDEEEGVLASHVIDDQQIVVDTGTEHDYQQWY